MKRFFALVLAAVLSVSFAGCGAKEKIEPTAPSETETCGNTEIQMPKEPFTGIKKPRKKTQNELIEDAMDITSILIRHSLSRRILPGVEDIEGAFSRHSNDTVYKFAYTAAVLTVKGKSKIFKDRVEKTDDGRFAVVTLKDMKTVLKRLFNLNDIPKTLLESNEYKRSEQAFYFSLETGLPNWFDYNDMVSMTDADGNILIDVDLKEGNGDDEKSYGYYRLYYKVVEENGENYLRLMLIFKP